MNIKKKYSLKEGNSGARKGSSRARSRRTKPSSFAADPVLQLLKPGLACCPNLSKARSAANINQVEVKKKLSHCCASLLHFGLRGGEGLADLAEDLGGTQVVVGSVGDTGLQDAYFLLGEKVGLVGFHKSPSLLGARVLS